MKAASKMRAFSWEQTTTAVLRFSRCLYAQLTQQVAYPPKGMQMPPPGSPLRKAADLGLKLTMGFEMLMARAGYPQEGVQEGSASDRGTRGHEVGGPRWERFVRTLERRGFFGGNIPGSREHSRLLRNARDAFRGSQVIVVAQA